MSMNIKITILLLVVVGVSTYLVFSDTDETPATEDNQPKETQEVTSTEKAQLNESTSTDEVNTSENSSNATIITYTNDGFEPESIAIRKGNTVQFVNESGKKMWVASNIHPTHSLYPVKSADDCFGSSFDQCESIPNETSWEFVFDVAGEFKYHNHVRARDGGTIIVSK